MIGQKNKSKTAIAISATLGGAFGLAQSVGAAGNFTEFSAARSAPAPNVNKTAEALLDAIVASNSATENANGSDGENIATALDDTNQNAFPHVVATAEIDGDSIATFRMPDGSLISRKVGETLPGGWTLTTLSITEIVAHNGETKEQISLLNNLGSVEDAPEP